MADEVDAYPFGGHIHSLREARGLTQEQLAERSGLAIDTIRRLERQDFSPSLRTLEKLGRGLGLSLTSMFGSFELREFSVADEFVDMLGARPLSEHRPIANIWRTIAAELDAAEVVEASGPDETGRPYFGRHVRALRKARGLTQEILAERCDLSPDTIRRLEHASLSPTLDTLNKLCEGLGMSLPTLFVSLDLMERDRIRELADLLHGRSPAVLDMVLRVLALVLEIIDGPSETEDPE